MYAAKDAGRNAIRFFANEMNSSVLEDVRLVSGMRTALARGEFMLHYQPQFDLASDRIVGAEALLRWRHPELGLVPPSRFIPIAEQSGLIIEIGAWVLAEACRQMQLWRAMGLAGLTISVNVSSLQFQREVIETDVVKALDASGLPASALDLELTESLLIQDSSMISGLLRRLRGRGVRFSIDDFGIGYSNLGYLEAVRGFTPEDRPVLHPQADRRQARQGHRPGDHPDDHQPRAGGDRRRRRDRIDVGSVD